MHPACLSLEPQREDQSVPQSSSALDSNNVEKAKSCWCPGENEKIYPKERKSRMHEQSRIPAIERTKSKKDVVEHVFDPKEGLERWFGALAALAEALGLGHG